MCSIYWLTTTPGTNFARGDESSMCWFPLCIQPLGLFSLSWPMVHLNFALCNHEATPCGFLSLCDFHTWLPNTIIQIDSLSPHIIRQPSCQPYTLLSLTSMLRTSSVRCKRPVAVKSINSGVFGRSIKAPMYFPLYPGLATKWRSYGRT